MKEYSMEKPTLNEMAEDFDLFLQQMECRRPISSNNSHKGTQTQTQTPPPQQRHRQQEDDRLYMPALASFKRCSAGLGLLVGFFIYLSTLGAEFVGVMLWGREILQKSNSELIFFSLLWNLITTIIAIVILSSLRRLLSLVFVAASNCSGSSSNNQRSRDNVEDILSELLSYMEGRFAVGALVGICTSWNVTNAVLGMKPQVIQSVIILAVACLWCRMTLVLLGTPEQSLIYDTQEEPSKAKDEEEGLGLSTPLLV